jgi:hypothetical protein
MALVVAVGLALVVGYLSRIPTSYAGENDALLRLSWRVLGTMVEECRTRTPEELEALAPHMRTPRVCTGLGADYELTVRLDGADVVRDTLRPAGARRDRPVYVFREIEVEPGTHRVVVGFRALVPSGFESTGRTLEYAWEGDVRVAPAEIALLTIEDDALVTRRP